ncbi:hypothetical protein CRYUN_Cryun04dG0046000 [Craigia yunnanensis]
MTAAGNKSVIVRQVFAEDLKREFAIIYDAIAKYPFVSMDTEFPGTIFKQDKRIIQESNPVINYQYMKSNVDVVKIIQLGNLPDFGTPYCYVWEFNFRDFDIDKDRYVSESIERATWITFHSAYDFGFLMKILTQQPLPCNLNSFMGQLGGLEKVATTLNVARVAGLSHQAGSDSLLTLQCFMELKKLKFDGRIYNRTPSDTQKGLILAKEII